MSVASGGDWRGVQVPLQGIAAGADNGPVIDPTTARALADLRGIAREIYLEDLLLELRRFYRGEQDQPYVRSCPVYQRVCEEAVHALDAALWRLESGGALEDW